MITTISNSILTAQIKKFGAELCSLKNKSGKEFMWEGKPAIWGKHSPILFPIVGTLKDNSYTHNGREYQMSRHGFARDMDFEVFFSSENSVGFSLQATNETKKMYPFDFELQIIYTVEKNKLQVAYKVINKEESQIPFSIGAHPAFSLEDNFENYSIEFEKEEKLVYYLLEKDLISTKTKPLELHEKKMNLNYQLFENDALIFKSLQSKTITILENYKPVLKVAFEDFPSLGIWTKNEAPFLCIEPWFGYSDTETQFGNLFEKEGIQILNKGEQFESKYSIEIL